MSEEPQQRYHGTHRLYVFLKYNQERAQELAALDGRDLFFAVKADCKSLGMSRPVIGRTLESQLECGVVSFYWDTSPKSQLHEMVKGTLHGIRPESNDSGIVRSITHMQPLPNTFNSNYSNWLPLPHFFGKPYPKKQTWSPYPKSIRIPSRTWSLNGDAGSHHGYSPSSASHKSPTDEIPGLHGVEAWKKKFEASNAVEKFLADFTSPQKEVDAKMQHDWMVLSGRTPSQTQPMAASPTTAESPAPLGMQPISNGLSTAEQSAPSGNGAEVQGRAAQKSGQPSPLKPVPTLVDGPGPSSSPLVSSRWAPITRGHTLQLGDHIVQGSNPGSPVPSTVASPTPIRPSSTWPGAHPAGFTTSAAAPRADSMSSPRSAPSQAMTGTRKASAPHPDDADRAKRIKLSSTPPIPIDTSPQITPNLTADGSRLQSAAIPAAMDLRTQSFRIIKSCNIWRAELTLDEAKGHHDAETAKEIHMKMMKSIADILQDICMHYERAADEAAKLKSSILADCTDKEVEELQKALAASKEDADRREQEWDKEREELKAALEAATVSRDIATKTHEETLSKSTTTISALRVQLEEAERQQLELHETHLQLKQAKEKLSGLELQLQNTDDQSRQASTKLSESEEKTARLESDLEEALIRTARAERELQAVREECREPFVVPSLLDAFLEIASRDVPAGST